LRRSNGKGRRPKQSGTATLYEIDERDYVVHELLLQSESVCLSAIWLVCLLPPYHLFLLLLHPCAGDRRGRLLACQNPGKRSLQLGRALQRCSTTQLPTSWLPDGAGVTATVMRNIFVPLRVTSSGMLPHVPVLLRRQARSPSGHRICEMAATRRLPQTRTAMPAAAAPP